MSNIEQRLVNFVSHIMELYDAEVAEINDGFSTCRWVHEKTMLQLTVGSMIDSAYSVHTDCGFHHNHYKG